MSYRVVNISDRIIGLLIDNGTSLVQHNLLPQEYIIVENVTDQIRRLSALSKLTISLLS